MLYKKLKRQAGVKSDEEIKNIVRYSLISWTGPIFFSILFIILPFFLIYPLFRQGEWGVVAFTVLLLAGLLLAWRTYLCYYFTVFIMTDRRVIDLERSGFLKIFITSVLYNRIQDVNFTKKFFRGSVVIHLLGDKKVSLVLDGIRNPEKLVSEIIGNQEEYYQRKTRVRDNRAIATLKRIKAKLGEKEFNALIGD
jgi:hypothetical protein